MKTTCPLCKSNKTRIIGPKKKGLYKCRGCGVIFNSLYSSANYSDSYFIDDYKKQYGKTYLEDYKNIYSISLKRLDFIIKRFFSKNSIKDLSIMDLGCALGFFLKAAHDKGITKVRGLEISNYASNYCKKELNIPVINSTFEKAYLEETFDIITAWYFIEHCNNTMEALKKIYQSLKKGGLFAFSIPSSFGPLYLFNRTQWIETHPADHLIDFSPVTAKKYLKKVGFKKIIINSAGIHPERVLSQKSKFYKPFCLLYSAFSRAAKFSDTIEVYAVK